MTVHVQLEVLFVPEALVAQLAAQVLDGLEVRVALADVRPQAAEHHVRAAAVLAVVLALGALALASGPVRRGLLLRVVALLAAVALERRH